MQTLVLEVFRHVGALAGILVERNARRLSGPSAILVLVSISATACANAQGVDFVRLANDDHAYLRNSGFVAPVRTIIDNEADWEGYWRLLHARIPSAGEPQTIDFERKAVVLVSTGEIPSGGYDIVVDGARSVGGRLVIQVLLTRPGADCLVSSVVESPVDVALVPLPAEPVDFVERWVTRECID